MARCNVANYTNTNILKLLRNAVYMLHTEVSNSTGSADELIKDFWTKSLDEH